jgi:hypothetical protein
VQKIKTDAIRQKIVSRMGVKPGDQRSMMVPERSVIADLS